MLDGIIERIDGRKSGRPAYPTEVMVRVMVLKRLYNLSDEQMEYPSAQRREMLVTLGFKAGLQRKAQAGKPLSDCQQRRNHRIAKRRARVEHVFASIRHIGGKFVRTIGQARASTAMTMMAACYNLKRLASFLDNKVDPFFKPTRSKRQVRVQTAKA